MAATSIANLRQQIQLVKDAVTSPEAFRKMHAEVARSAVAELEAQQGKYPRTTAVDGRRGAAEESVKFGGVIEYDISPINDVVDAAYEELASQAPVRTGNYLRHIRMFVNGVRRDAEAGGSPLDIGPGDEVTFLDDVPYARKIEGGNRFIGSFGRTERRAGLSAMAPDGVFEISARALKRRFGNYPVDIAFEYRLYDGADAYRPKLGEGGSRRFPAVTIKVL